MIKLRRIRLAEQVERMVGMRNVVEKVEGNAHLEG
jgi:hypothetical protein